MKIVHFLVGCCSADSANGVDKTVYYPAKHEAALEEEVTVICV